MNIPEEFGKYLLLKKLAEDALGETFRAGRVGKDAIEQVVLLRVFNGRGVDGEKLWQKVEERGGVQTALRSPNIGTGVDLGRVRSFPYTAYDYVSGKSLATVLGQARRMRTAVPPDHALLIAERIAVSLAAAYETRFRDERILHGFVVPQLVMVSNEGETRMLGFEVAPGLREVAAGGWSDESVTPYLAPETAGGGAAGKNDDVYSLGAILFELLTGERPPQGGEAAGVIDRATLGGDVAPLPPAVAALLKRSLAPRGERLADSVTWHKTLSKLMIEGHYSPTTFNLAFFMHSLFRDEIEKESQELQAEKKLELPSRPVPLAAAPSFAPLAAVPAATAPISTSPAPVREGSLAGAAVVKEVRSGSKAGLWIGLAALLLLVGAGAGWYFVMGPGAKPSPPSVASPSPAPSPAPVEIAATPAGPTPEELQVQIQEMFEAQSREMESKLKSQYDDRIRQLQDQLENSRRATAEQQRAAAERQQAPPEEPPQVARVETPAPPPVLTPTPAPPTRTEPEPEKPVQVAAATPAPVVPSPTPRPQPAVQYGDLVQMGAGVIPPKVIVKAEPRYPPSAARLKRAAQVEVKVLIDERGRVMDAERVSAKAGFGFDEAALDAARRSTFQAATKSGVRVKMWYTLRFHFKPRE